MKRIVRLTESDLARIVKRVIREQDDDFDDEPKYRDMTSEEEVEYIEDSIDRLGNNIDMYLNELAELQDEIEQRDDFDSETKNFLLLKIEDIMLNIQNN